MTDGPRSTFEASRPVSVGIRLVAIGLLALLLHRIGVRSVLDAMSAISAVDLSIALVAGVAGHVLYSRELAEVYRFSGGIRPDGMVLAREGAEVALMNLALPLSGSVRRAVVVRRRTGAAGRFVVGLLVQNGVVLAVAGILVAVGLVTEAGPGRALGSVVFVLIPLIITAAVHRADSGSVRLVLGVVPWATGRVLLVGVRLGVLAGGIADGDVFGRADLIRLLGVAGATVLTMLVPFLPGGLGLREFLIIRSSDWLRVDATEAAAVALTDRGVAVVAGMFVLLATGVALRRRRSIQSRRDPRAAD